MIVKIVVELAILTVAVVAAAVAMLTQEWDKK